MRLRISQCNMCKDHMKMFSHFMTKYDLKPYHDRFSPAIFYGMYVNDVDVLKKHKSLAVVVWRGSDVLKIKRLRLAIKKKAKHVAISSFIAKDLKKAGAKCKFIPLVSANTSSFKPVPMGDEIYVYAIKQRYDFYGGKLIDKLRKRCKYKINLVRKSSRYSRNEIRDIYERCFCGLRLTPHDGIANTVIELGLMGRRCIYNGQVPNAIPWKRDPARILELIEQESSRIGTTDYETSEAVRNYITVGDEWLDTAYWENK